jgi:protein-export membrane protein SecD
MVHFAKWKTIATLAVLLAGILFAAPNLLTQEQAEALPGWLPHQQISLGLDLQGGSHLLYEVDLTTVIKERMDATRLALRDQLRKHDILFSSLKVINGALVLQLKDPTTRDKTEPLLEDLLGSDMIYQTGDAGTIRIEYTPKALSDIQQQILAQSIEIIKRRVDEEGVREPTVIRQGQDRIIVQMPGLKDPERLKGLIKETAKMTFQFVAEAQGGTDSEDTLQLPFVDGGTLTIERRVMVSGEDLVDAQLAFDQYNAPVVSFKFDSRGARLFGDATRTNVGRRFAIVLDGKVISAPVIREPILGGSGQISGGFTPDEARDLAMLLRAGALPAPLKVLEERTVGPELGADSIAAGKMASIMGLLLIVVALLAVYGLFGIFANIALVFNFILLLAAMSLLQATLTLPGIAGMVLTLGMAVDANVLIHERIREEIRNGRGPVMAIDAGYRSASGTIMDSNLTVIISSAFLYLFGSGTVKGFAITLILGTVISMFTAVVVARLCTVVWLRQTRPQVLPI